MHVHSPSFALNDTVIGEVATVKYLGHAIANDMTDDETETSVICTRQCLIKAISYVLHWGEKYTVSLVLYTDVYLPVILEFFCTKHA